MWHSTSGMGWWMVFGGFWMVAVLGFFIWLLVSFTSKVNNEKSVNKEDPMEIARRRLASGEITKEQFDEIQQRLK